jgi:uncharacterized protein (TIGR01777 family)
MKAVIAGGTGFLGRPLAELYAEEGHQVTVLTRRLAPAVSEYEAGTGLPGITHLGWKPDGSTGPWAAVIDGADLVVNLSGESIGGARWTPEHKARVRDSRISATTSLVAAIRGAARPPATLISGSAKDYYGPRGDEPVGEEEPQGRGFLADVTGAWEREALAASPTGARVAIIRTGLVIEKSGGALPRMMTPVRLFAGGPLGSGRQYVSWIHRADWLEMVRWIARTPQAKGAFNATAPDPVPNAVFMKALARALRRPSWLPAPAFGLRLMLGEMADELLLTGQRAVPSKALSMGFRFHLPQVDQAMKAIFREA